MDKCVFLKMVPGKSRTIDEKIDCLIDMCNESKIFMVDRKQLKYLKLIHGTMVKTQDVI